MFGFRRRKAEAPTDWATLEQVRRIIEDMVAPLAKNLRGEMERLRSLVHEAQDDVGEIRTKFDDFERTVHAEIRTLCQNAAEATRAIADTMAILRPTLMKIRDRNLKKEAAEKCPKE